MLRDSGLYKFTIDIDVDIDVIIEAEVTWCLR